MVTVHLMSDEKFIDDFIERLERVSTKQHRYIVFSNQREPKYIKSSLCIRKPENSLRTLLEIYKIKNLDKIILHSVSVNFRCITPFLPKNKKIIWIFYGYEYFSLPSVGNSLIQENTLDLRKTVYSKIMNFFSNIKAKIYEKISLLTFRRVTHFAHFIKEDFETIKNTIKTRAQFVEFTYGIKLIHILKTTPETRANICLGNSGSPFNNHIEAINILSKMNIADRKVFCPLSYGGRKSYVSQVIEKGKDILGDNFKPLTEFFNIDEYNDLMATCGFTILNHKRPQAAGNALARIYQGGKVFFCDNSFYRMLKNAGIQVYLIGKDFVPDNPEAFDPLCTEAIKRNRKIIEDLFGEEKLIERYSTLDAL